ncbi:hypothetical protein CH365_19735, partial [Leptospira neocaledonica]
LDDSRLRQDRALRFNQRSTIIFLLFTVPLSHHGASPDFRYDRCRIINLCLSDFLEPSFKVLRRASPKTLLRSRSSFEGTNSSQKSKLLNKVSIQFYFLLFYNFSTFIIF